jgi:hypothetical protein
MNLIMMGMMMPGACRRLLEVFEVLVWHIAEAVARTSYLETPRGGDDDLTRFTHLRCDKIGDAIKPFLRDTRNRVI